ncbi:Uma2 family endonuclease [Cronbergia sp. UHCC 0137]|uniref:Uma2 family endonuclease n=1 Tax=Cronbergia sp. UHCC 0137 TaxID=3110239 RepID=UPI002B20E287|nr:Uma2 family endonuclease [Cronbergia sp. UHCC 0137]MEA5619437.1 Uma2 family endonuclease [Cronbergia sp. UHCC 0137]
MVNSPAILTTIPTDTWVQANWEDFITFADDPTLTNGRFYYDQGYMRIEMLPIGSAHSQDNSIISTVVILYAAIKNIPIKELTNASFRKIGVRESQPDIAFYIGNNLIFPPRNNEPINLNELDPPSLVVEIAASSLEDDTTRKQKLYQRLGIKEYWVVDVRKTKIIAYNLAANQNTHLEKSQVLPELPINLVEQALHKSQTEDDGAITRWLLTKFSAN